MGAIHAACLRSFVRLGHEVTLHGYTPPDDLPDGILFRDASALLPEEMIFRHRKTGSLAPFCDLLRYEILSQGLGLYVDCDVYCVKPIFDEDYVMGKQVGGSINNSVLKTPTKCPALRDLLNIVSDGNYIPPWWSRSRKMKWKMKSIIKRRGLRDLPYGSTGPYALTYYLSKHGLLEKAAEMEVFNPVSPYEVDKLLDPNMPLSSLLKPSTKTLHLYNEALRKLDLTNPPKGSSLYEILHSG